MTISCFQWFKDTNLKANHNIKVNASNRVRVVSNGSKILIWKQITTHIYNSLFNFSCFQWFKDTNLKANHNSIYLIIYCTCGCFQWFKDTNLKANHNIVLFGTLNFIVVSNGSKLLIWKQITTAWTVSPTSARLFPMVQRY